MPSSVGSVKKNYSRSEWSALSIQQRIRAMTETLNDVEVSKGGGRDEFWTEVGRAGRGEAATIDEEDMSAGTFPSFMSSVQKYKMGDDGTTRDDRTTHSCASEAGGHYQPQQTTRYNSAKLPMQKHYSNPSDSHFTNAFARTPPPPGRSLMKNNNSLPSMANTPSPSSTIQRESVIDIWRKRDTSSPATNAPLSKGSGAGPNKMPQLQTATSKSQSESQLGSMGTVAPAPSTTQPAWMQNRNNSDSNKKTPFASLLATTVGDRDGTNNSARKQPFNQRTPIENSSAPHTQPQYQLESLAATTPPVTSTSPISKRPPSTPQSLSISAEPADLTIVPAPSAESNGSQAVLGGGMSSSTSMDRHQQQPQGSQERPKNIRDFWAQRGLQPISSSDFQQQLHNNMSSASTSPSGGTRIPSPTPSLSSTAYRVSVVDRWKQRFGAAAASAAHPKPKDNNTPQGDEARVANNDWRRESSSSSNNSRSNPSKNNPFSSSSTTSTTTTDPNDSHSEAARPSLSSDAHTSALGRWKKRSSISPAMAAHDKEEKISPKTMTNNSNNGASPRKDPQTRRPNERQGLEVRAESPSVLPNSCGQASVMDPWKTRSSSPVGVAGSCPRQEAELVAKNDKRDHHHQKVQSHASHTSSVLSSSNTANTAPSPQGSVLDRWKLRSSSPALLVQSRKEPRAPKTVPRKEVQKSEAAATSTTGPSFAPSNSTKAFATPQRFVFDRWKSRCCMLRFIPNSQHST